jgi:hypothetical protein
METKREKYVRMGYRFSGFYSGDKSEIKQKQIQLKQEGYKTAIITEKDLERYTTGTGGKIYHIGYALYTKPKEENTVKVEELK